MFITVRLLNQFQEPLLYAVPASWPEQPIVGSMVRVPLRGKPVTGWVTQTLQEKPASVQFAIKDALYIEQMPHDPHYGTFITHLAQYHATEPTVLLGRLR